MNNLYFTTVKKFTKILGVLGVTAMFFSACDQPANNSTTDAGGGVDSEINISDLKIAYIHTDSVINNYTYFKEKSVEIAEKGKRYEGELSNRAKGFEQEVASFQQSASTMTMNQARAKEEELVTKERNLVSYRDNLMQELSADESKLYNDVYDRIQVYLKEYAKENELEMILSYTRGGGVWYAREELDITNSVSEGINQDFETSKTATPKEEPAAPEAEKE